MAERRCCTRASEHTMYREHARSNAAYKWVNAAFVSCCTHLLRRCTTCDLSQTYKHTEVTVERVGLLRSRELCAG